MKAHQNNSKDFDELTYSEQSKSINASIMNLEAAISAHLRRAKDEHRQVLETLENTKQQVGRMISRLEEKKSNI